MDHGVLNAVTLGDGFGKIGEGHQDELSIRLEIRGVSHGASVLEP